MAAAILPFETVLEEILNESDAESSPKTPLCLSSDEEEPKYDFIAEAIKVFSTCDELGQNKMHFTHEARYGWRIVSKFKKNIHSTSTIVFTFKKNIHSTSTIIFTLKENIHSTSTIVFTFKKNIYSTSTIVFTFKKNIYSTSTIVFTFKKNIYSTLTIVFTFKKNIYSTSTIVFTFKKNIDSGFQPSRPNLLAGYRSNSTWRKPSR